MATMPLDCMAIASVLYVKFTWWKKVHRGWGDHYQDLFYAGNYLFSTSNYDFLNLFSCFESQNMAVFMPPHQSGTWQYLCPTSERCMILVCPCVSRAPHACSCVHICSALIDFGPNMHQRYAKFWV